MGDVNLPRLLIAVLPGTKLAPPPPVINTSGPISTNSRSYGKQKRDDRNENRDNDIRFTVVNSRQRSR